MQKLHSGKKQNTSLTVAGAAPELIFFDLTGFPFHFDLRANDEQNTHLNEAGKAYLLRWAQVNESIIIQLKAWTLVASD